MKKLYSSTAAKITAVILFILLLTAAVGGAIGTVYMSSMGFYSDKLQSFYDLPLCADITEKYKNIIYYDYLHLYMLSKTDSATPDQLRKIQYYKKMFSPENTNFMFTVTDTGGNVVLSNYRPDDGALLIWVDKDSPGWIDKLHGNIYDKDALVESYVKGITAKDDYFLPYTLYSLKYTIIALTALSALIAAALFVFLMRSAGRIKESCAIALGFADKIPLDLLVAFVLFFWFCIANISLNAFRRANVTWYALIFCTAGGTASLLGILLCMSFAARVKAGKWWRNTVLYRFWKLLNIVFKAIGTVIFNLPLLWKTIVLFLMYLLINGFFVILLSGAFWALTVLLGFLFNMAVLLGLCHIMLHMNRLKLGAEKISAGDYDSKIDTKNMFWDLKLHADTLNNIGIGMSKAVDQRLKSERLKTELITNVSHDIKTPLTSIINYVDLLKKVQIENSDALQYLEILDKQALRLKKLTEDLVEASKASTGNMTVSLQRIDIAEFLNQSIGEYSERFASGALELIVNSPEEKNTITADGRLLWRVFDNLFSNILKYALPGTRVYLNVNNCGSKVMITLKNISRSPLNISSDELMERFVRGDISRSTEGSGLGLSIAKSLTELMRGSFELSLDGDLFKVTIRFDCLDINAPILGK